mgnify:CR=1 FL=1
MYLCPAYLEKRWKKEGMMVVDIKNIVTRLPELRFTAPVNWRIDEGQQWL